MTAADDRPGLSHNAALKVGLRNLLFRSKAGPEWVFSNEATDILLDLWQDVAPSVDEPDRRPPDGLEASVIRELDGWLVRVIGFPRPERMAENYLAAVAYRPARRRFLFWRVERRVRYLALEFGLKFPEGTPRTVLGEWTTNTHVTYCDGPEPTVDNFLEAIRPILANRSTRVSMSVSPRQAD